MIGVVDPMSFQALALAWIGTLTVVVGALLTALLTLWPKVAELRDKATAHDQQIHANEQAIRRLNPNDPPVLLKEPPA